MKRTGMTTLRHALVTGLVLQFLFPSLVLAFEGSGSTGANYLTHSIGCKSIAMGEAKAALRGDRFNWLAAPGAFQYLEGRGVGVSHAEWLIDTRYNNLSFYNRVNGRFIVGGGFVYTYRPDIQGYDILGPTEKIRSYNYQLIVGLGYSPVSNFTAGANVKYFREKLGEWDEGGACVDLGALWTWEKRGVSVGFTVQNIGPDIKSETMDEPLPLTMRFGVGQSVAIRDELSVSYALDMVKRRYEDPYVGAGIELEIYDLLAVRGGYVSDEARAGNGLTMGCGVMMKESISLDYAWTPYGDLGSIHRISIFYGLD